MARKTWCVFVAIWYITLRFTFRTNFCQDLHREMSDRVPVFSYLNGSAFRASSNGKPGRPWREKKLKGMHNLQKYRCYNFAIVEKRVNERREKVTRDYEIRNGGRTDRVC